MPKTNKELIKAAIDSGTLVNGGLLNPKQAKKFLQYIFESTDLLKAVRTLTMTQIDQEFPNISIGSRIVTGRTSEGQDMTPFEATVDTGKVVMKALPYDLPWTLSDDVLDDNVEGKGFANTVAKMMAEQFGVDSEDVGVNGDTTQPVATALAGAIDAVVTTISVADASSYAYAGEAGVLVIETEQIIYDYKDGNDFIGCVRGANGTTAATHADTTAVTFVKDGLIGFDDGWLKKMYEGGSHYTDLSAINSGAITKAHFFALLNSLPKKYRTGSMRKKLKWVMSPNTKSNWDEYLTDRLTNAGDAVLAGSELNPLGIGIIECSSLRDDQLFLTDPKNLVFGVFTKIKIRKSDSGKDSIRKHEVYYNASTKMDFQLERDDSVAYGDGLTG